MTNFFPLKFFKYSGPKFRNVLNEKKIKNGFIYIEKKKKLPLKLLFNNAKHG